MSGEFILLEEDRDEFTDVTVFGVQPVGTGQFLMLEPDRDEYTYTTIFGVEAEEPEPEPEIGPRGRIRRRKYIDRISLSNVAELKVLEGYSEKKRIEVLLILEKYYKEQNINSINMAVKNKLVYSVKGLGFYEACVSKLIVKGLCLGILKTTHLTEKIIFLSSFSSEFNVITPDLNRTNLKRMMRYLGYLDED